MNKMTSAELRQAFLDYFGELNHEIVASSPLPNYDNPTLLFTNAGMNQFTDVFLGKEKRVYNRAVTSQKVMRVSGKHNDLENVGFSLRHHTFFEMLGNFSFGDYFKSEAIDYGFNFLTKVLDLDPERIYATVYNGLKDGKPFMEADDEAAKLWERYLPKERIRGYSYDDNYWVMGDTGPNGPCSELHYYLGDLDNVPIELLNSDDDVDEAFLEVWNLVFMQYGTDENGVTTPLPAPSIDTGMSLERLARILQSSANNYETDLFSPVLDKVQELLGDSDAKRNEYDQLVGYRVIADHGRAATFLIGDGLIPGNNGAPYVLRMIIRRAARFGRKIGFTKPFLADIAQTYIDEMGAAYPDIVQRADFIKQSLTQEEKRFNRTLDNALLQLDKAIDEMDDTVIDGNFAFDLHATYGLPIEITRDLAKERSLTVDEAGFAAAKEAHKVASGAGAFGVYEVGENVYADALADLITNGTLDENGVDHDPYSGASESSHIIGIFKDGAIADSADTNDQIELITTATPFYVNSGGEVSDTGKIVTDSAEIKITDVVKPVPGLIIHVGKVIRGSIKAGDLAMLQVDNMRRADIRRNHTATHILHEELREKLGTHVTQQGSLVAPDRLRFDFSHGQAVTASELADIEQKINAAVLANYGVVAEIMPKDDAIKMGAMALFGEKYGDIVRTVQIGEGGNYSTELCGGLHVSNTGEIGSFHFVSEGSAAAGIRRIEAVTGGAAQAYVSDRIATLSAAADKLNTTPDQLNERLDAILSENKRMQKELDSLKRGNSKAQFDGLLDSAETLNGSQLLVAQVEGADADGLRELTDLFKSRVSSGVVLLATVSKDKPLFIAAVTKDLIGKGIKAGDLVREMGQIAGGGGGGAPHLAQAGGRDATKVGAALEAAAATVKSNLN